MCVAAVVGRADDVAELVDVAVGVAVGGQAHHLPFAAGELEAEELGHGPVEQAQRLGEAELLERPHVQAVARRPSRCSPTRRPRRCERIAALSNGLVRKVLAAWQR